jgi:hypothetical protein
MRENGQDESPKYWQRLSADKLRCSYEHYLSYRLRYVNLVGINSAVIQWSLDNFNPR